MNKKKPSGGGANTFVRRWAGKKIKMSNEIKKRERPILTVACPICDSVFSVTALHSDFIGDDAEENERIIRELTDYAMQGMNIRVVDKPQDYSFHYCEHVKNRER